MSGSIKTETKGINISPVAYRDGGGQVRLFYPDYIVQMADGDTWIIEAEGGEAYNQSQNIDGLAETKFKEYKDYMVRHQAEQNLKWGFVRNIGEELYLNNTEWEEAMATNDKWISIEEFF